MKKKFQISPCQFLSLVLSILGLFSILMFSGCLYYKVSTKKTVTAEDLRWAKFNNKYLILHWENWVWHLEKAEIADDRLSGRLLSVPNSRITIKNNAGDNSMRYKKSKEAITLDQVHLYVDNPFYINYKAGDSISIRFSEISKVETYLKDKGKTNTQWILAVATSLVIVGGVAAIIIAATSCPYVYVKNKDGFIFTGEIFGGAVYSSLERHDFLPLPAIEPCGNRYTLKISNELAEIQHVNLAELWIVNHPDTVRVLPDRHGNIHSIEAPVLPLAAYSAAKNDVLPLVSKSDQNCFLFDEEPSLTGDSNAINSVDMNFSITGKADTGKLIIKAGNSLWGDFTYSEFTKFFGNKYDKWIKSQRKVPPEKNNQWKMDQQFVMMVYLETANGWKFVDYFDLIGPLGKREMIMAIALSEALVTSDSRQNSTIRIRVVSGFKFWELDYATMDFSKNIPVTLDYAKPGSATTGSGKDIMQLIENDDKKYYDQHMIGEEGVIVYQDSPRVPSMKKSIFLHAKGYYEHVRDYPGPPDVRQLLTFGIPGRLSQFSFTNYQEFVNIKAVLVTDTTLQ